MSDTKSKLTLFCSDLDNTLIYSGRHEIKEEKVCVEYYEGREASFMTRRSLSLLRAVREKALFVPVTTRTTEQYRRIDLGINAADYALVCNGGVLLRDEKEVPKWQEESLRLTAKSRGELLRAEGFMEQDKDRIMEVRNIRMLFLFTKSSRPMEMAQRLRKSLDTRFVNIFTNGQKVYVLPVGLDKGTAVQRFRDYIATDRVWAAGEKDFSVPVQAAGNRGFDICILAAGDSEFDIPMLAAADRAYAPGELMGRCHLGAHVSGISEEGVFSDAFLQRVIEEI